MDLNSINSHPILSIPERKQVSFTFDGKKLIGFKDMMISSALFMNGIKIFGHHPKDGSPQGIFCANGQCAQCTVIVDGYPKKSCMTPLKEGMVIESCNSLPELPAEDNPVNVADAQILETDVLIIGAGPAGLSASKLLGEKNVNVILVDDKDRTGGKLVLQTHKFFGSQKDVYAGKRGIDIGQLLGDEVRKLPSVEIWLNSTALAVFRDGFVGILKENSKYILVKPKNLLVASGAREKMLIFPGDTLPGVYGAGAFQTLVNRDLVRPAKKIFIVGGGNVGLIAGYHAIQANIEVVGLIEALPKCGGYYVHETKLRRLGVPIYTRHTIISANGENEVESITIGELDEKWNVIPGTEKTFACDTILIAVGLNPVNEFYVKAKEFGIKAWVAGDAQEIAEASAAIFTGRIEAIKILKDKGIASEYNLSELEIKAKMMKAHPPPPGENIKTDKNEGAFPIFHCYQEIPCNPCTTVCPQNLIETVDNSLTTLPFFNNNQDCIACGRCVAVCPGLAITLVDTRKDAENPVVTFPYEISSGKLEKGQKVKVLDDSSILGEFPIARVRILKEFPRTQLVSIALPENLARKAVGIRAFEPNPPEPIETYHKKPIPDEAIVCRCERVTAGEIRNLIKSGITDVNQIKAITRAGMGACGAKTCGLLIDRLYREEGISQDKITEGVKRPLFVEVPLKYFASVDEGDEE